ncbi:MAG: RsmE family RNA methyltransferase [Acidimicrobiia bacterium]
MRHLPHLLVPGEWGHGAFELEAADLAHLTRVLRLSDGDTVSYTDGAGRVGHGRLEGRVVARGTESEVPRPRDLTVAVAPPRQRDRARFLVEKVQEIGVRRLMWLDTDHGEGKPPSDARVAAWRKAAIEQSRGAWLVEVNGPVRLADLENPLLCDPDGEPIAHFDDTGPIMLAVGPEGGWSNAERDGRSAISLGSQILRVETAAVVAAGIILHGR